jgi:Bacterial type III secretion protein (HrpB2)
MNPNPVDAIGSVDTALKTARMTLETVPAETPSMEALTQRFQDMMHAPHATEHPSHAQSPDGPNAITNVLSRGEEMLSQTQAEVNQLRADAPHLSPTELAVRSIEVANNASMSSFRMQAATQIASGANKSVQTLLKNQ